MTLNELYDQDIEVSICYTPKGWFWNIKLIDDTCIVSSEYFDTSEEAEIALQKTIKGFTIE